MRRFCVLLFFLLFGVLVTDIPAYTQTVLNVRGIVVDGVTDAPIAGATIESSTAEVVSDEAGRFAITVAQDDTVLRIVSEGYFAATVSLTAIFSGVSNELQVLLSSNTFKETVQVSPPVSISERPSATSVVAEEVFEAAGSLDNIFRTLDTLPGVASTGDFGSRLAVRGGTPEQNLTVMDGVEIHNPYRLFGLVSAFNPETIEQFELTAGGFGAAYGDRLSSVLVVDNRIGRSDFQGSASISATDGNFVAEGAVLGNGTWLLSGRRTYYDVVAGLITDQNLPSFTDVQLPGNWEFGVGHRLSAFGLSSRENADFMVNKEDSRNTGNFLADAGNDLISLQFESLFGATTTSRTTVSWYRNTELISVDGTFESLVERSNTEDDQIATSLTDVIFAQKLSVRDLAVRQELSLQLSSTHTVDSGVELHHLTSNVNLSITGDRNFGVANPSSARGGTGLPGRLDSLLTGTRGGAWLQDRYTPVPRLSIESGLRVGWSTVNDHVVLSPRVAATFGLGWSSRLRIAGGFYAQSPGYEKLIQSDYFFDLSPASVENLRHERATHLVSGFERDFGGSVLARVEGYYKTFDDLIVGQLESPKARHERVARYDFPADLRDHVSDEAQITSVPTNGGSGRAYGVDAYLVSKVSDARLTGWLSYAWGRADRETYGLRYPFEYDRRHAFNAVGRYRLGTQWSVAMTGQVATGFPYTVATGLRVSAEEENIGRLIPKRDSTSALVYAVDFGSPANLHRGRLPHYARVDLRISQRPGGESGRWSWYVEVINLLNRDNPVEMETQLVHAPDALVPSLVESPTAGFPILPSFGVRVRF